MKTCFLLIWALGLGYVSSETPLRFASAPHSNIFHSAAQGPLELPCLVIGDPVPTITWTVNGSVVPNDGSFTVLSNSSLFLPAPSSSQSGRYSCIARNEFSQIQSTSFVTISGGQVPSVVSSEGSSDQSVVIGSNVRFACPVNAPPGATLRRQWFFKGSPIDVNAVGRVRIDSIDGSLTLTQVRPANIGRYTCRVYTDGGRLLHETSSNLLIVEKPGMPLHVTARLLNDTMPVVVEVGWLEGFDGNSPILSYNVQQRTLGARGLWSEWQNSADELSSDTRRVTVDALKPSMTYEFRVIAVNKFGGGHPSLSSNNITMPQQPPAAAPQGIAGSARSSQTIMVQWQPPPIEQWNGDLLGYLLRYRLADYPNIPWSVANVSEPHSLNYLIEDLITWREYEIQVAAFNNRGAGVYSTSLFITTLEGVPTEAPSDVTARVINSTSVEVEWVPPPQQQIPGVNLGYKVEFFDGSDWTQPQHTHTVLPYSLARLRVVVNGLGKYKTYNVTVLCYTTPGNGPRSSGVQITTLQDRPGPVKDFRFDEVLFSSIIVAWDPPVDSNGILQSYTLIYWTLANESDLAISPPIRNTLPPNATRHRIEGLQASTRYAFSIYATTPIGNGPNDTITVESGVPPELPGPPTALVVSNIQARSAVLQFRPGFDGKTRISRWLVQAQVGQSTDWIALFNASGKSTKQSSSLNTIALPSLRPHTRYRLRLVSVNVVGRSPPSGESERFETLQATPEYPPADVSVEPDSSQSLLITWTPLASNAWNGIPKGYIIMYAQIADKQPDDGPIQFVTQPSRVLVDDPSLGEHRLTNLQPFARYGVSIAAHNALGASNTTEVMRAMTYPDVPASSPTGVSVNALSPNELEVSWNPVAEEERRGPFLGYKITYYESGATRSPTDRLVDTAQATAGVTLSGLQPYTQYDVVVRGRTVMGDGPLSGVGSARTKVGLPDRPTNLVFSAVSPTEANIRWEPPLEPNGRVLRYAVSYRMNDSLPGSERREEIPEGFQSHRATHLYRNAWYRFEVKAKTDAGWGDSGVVYMFTSADKSRPVAPERPRQITSTTSEHADALRIAWTLGDGQPHTAPIRFYRLQVQRVNSDWVPYLHNADGESTQYLIEGLDPNNVYRFRVKAVNDFGESAWSPESSWMRTAEHQPSSPPRDLQASPYSATSVRLEWSPPDADSWNSDAIGFRMQYRPWNPEEEEEVEGKKNVWLSRDVKMGTGNDVIREATIDGLEQFTHYLVRVQSLNKVGVSALTAPVFVFVGYSIPKSGVSDLQGRALSSTQIGVGWKAWDGVEKINGFKVNYFSYPDTKNVHEEVLRASATSVTLRDLRKAARYVIKVWPFNKAGDGVAETVEVATSEDVPGPVGPLRFNDILLDSVNVSWSAPAELNGVITGYLVTYETRKLDSEFIKKIQERVHTTSLYAVGLESNVTYQFTVKAETTKGYGPPMSAKVTIGPQPGSPLSPSQPSMLASEQSLTLEWRNGPSGSAPITSYIVQRLIVEAAAKENTWTEHARVQSPRPAYTLPYTSLSSGQKYRFRVVARNARGVSNPSRSTAIFEAPEVSQRAWFMQWWFLVIVALVGIVIVLIVIALLQVTARNAKFNELKRSSTQSLHLADGGFVAYDVRNAQQRAKVSLLGAGGSLGTGSKRGTNTVNNPPRPQLSNTPFVDNMHPQQPRTGAAPLHAYANFYNSLQPNDAAVLYQQQPTHPDNMTEKSSVESVNSEQDAFGGFEDDMTGPQTYIIGGPTRPTRPQPPYPARTGTSHYQAGTGGTFYGAVPASQPPSQPPHSTNSFYGVANAHQHQQQIVGSRMPFAQPITPASGTLEAYNTAATANATNTLSSFV